MEIHGNSWKFMEIHGNSWKFLEILGNSWDSWKFMGFLGFLIFTFTHEKISHFSSQFKYSDQLRPMKFPGMFFTILRF